MRLLTFDEIEKLGHGEIIPAFECYVDKVWEQTTGTGQYGVWFLQNLDVTNSGGQQLRVAWGGEDKIDNLQGKHVRFESSETKHGPRGLTKQIKTKNGKTYKDVKVTGVAKIIVDPEDRVVREEKSIPAQDNTTVNAPLDPVNEVAKARELATKTGHLYLIALDEAWEVKKSFEGIRMCKMADEQFRVIASAIFIKLDKSGFTARMPEFPEPPAEPSGDEIPF